MPKELMRTKCFSKNVDKAEPKKRRSAKNTGMPVSVSEQILQSTLPVVERQRLLDGLLKDIVFHMGKEVTPRIIENVMLTALLPMLHDEIALALSGSPEARRYLLDKMIPKAERSVVAPPLNIKIYLDQGKGTERIPERAEKTERAETIEAKTELDTGFIEAAFTNLEVESEIKSTAETTAESAETNQT